MKGCRPWVELQGAGLARKTKGEMRGFERWEAENRQEFCSPGGGVGGTEPLRDGASVARGQYQRVGEGASSTP